MTQFECAKAHIQIREAEFKAVFYYLLHQLSFETVFPNNNLSLQITNEPANGSLLPKTATETGHSTTTLPYAEIQHRVSNHASHLFVTTVLTETSLKPYYFYCPPCSLHFFCISYLEGN